jgi:hypothetical protein
MKRRHLYVLLFLLPSLLLAAVAGATAAGMAAGFSWLFLFGDDSWPGWTGPAIGALAIGCGALVLGALLVIAWSVGRQQETRPSVDRGHLALALASTVLLGGLIGWRWLGAGERGPQTDSEACADYCGSEGFAASGTPPRDSGDRTCTCYDASGNAARQTALPADGPREHR